LEIHSAVIYSLDVNWEEGFGRNNAVHDVFVSLTLESWDVVGIEFDGCVDG
jgi:hypothetical protein